MKPCDVVHCTDFPCLDIDTSRFTVPDISVDPEGVRLLMISEAVPPSADDWYYAPGDPLFAQTTVQAFQDAGLAVQSLDDIRCK